MPGVLDIKLFSHRWFYLSLVPLGGLLALRIAGDLMFQTSLRMWGRLSITASSFFFFMMLVEIPIRSKLKRIIG